MKKRLLILVSLALAVGCISFPESADEHDESNEFGRQLELEPRVAAILSHKPRKGLGIQANSRAIFIFINADRVIDFSFVPGIPDKAVPGNQYTPEEVAVIGDAALSIKDRLVIKRKIRIYDYSIKKAHDAKMLEVGTKP
jgi:hypothetical protein